LNGKRASVSASQIVNGAFEMKKRDEISTLTFDETLHLIRRCGSLISMAGTPTSFMARADITATAKRVIDLVEQIDPEDMR
jgi:hypothetical protein